MSAPRPAQDLVVERSIGPAHDFHHRPLSWTGGEWAIWIHTVERPALVLGSSQPDDAVDRAAAEAAGFEVTGRRSGGGIVVVEPGQSCWIDVLISPRHPRWEADVNRAFGWVGDWWCAALTQLGVDGLEVHRGEVVDREFGRAVCFAGLGPGEVVQRDAADPERRVKVVGLSQRRTRDAARFQGLYLRRWDPEPIRRFAAPDALPAGFDLDDVAAGLPDGPAPDDVAAAFVSLAGQAASSASTR